MDSERKEMLETCPITRRKFDSSFKQYPDPNFNGYKYYFKPIGEIWISRYAKKYIDVNEEISLGDIAGISRCAHELGEPAPIIDTEFLDSMDKLKNIPRSFKEKYDHFLFLLYKTGGNEYKSRSIVVQDDYPLAFAGDGIELQRIVNFGVSSGDLECEIPINSEEIGTLIYSDLRITTNGINRIEKILNNWFSIIRLHIDSGNRDVDRKINHAISMFYQDNSTFEDKRSAAEELSYVLEPFREDLKNHFLEKDISLFFQLVNDFDIRHNKVTTKKIVYEEQIEWVFNGLLNTLLTYIKLNKKFKL